MNDLEYQSLYVSNFGGTISNNALNTQSNIYNSDIPLLNNKETENNEDNENITSIINKYEPMFSPFFGNLSENNFYIFISALGFLFCTNITMPIFKFLLIAIIALIIDNNYGVSIAIILYAISSLNKVNNLFIILLIVGALLHIFIRADNEAFNFNYIIQIILGILMLLSIYYEKQAINIRIENIPVDNKILTNYSGGSGYSNISKNSIFDSHFKE